jgi:hypothetical protein
MKNRGDESIQVIIHIYIEMSQGNSLYSYLKQTIILFLLQNWRSGWQNTSCGGWFVGTIERVEDVGKGYKRINTVLVLCTHVRKWKNENC